jgi:hypothetical protein
MVIMRAMRTLTLVLLLSAPAALAQSTATLRGVDVYRSRRLTSAAAKARFGPRLVEYVVLRNHRRPATDEKAEALRRRLEAEAASIPGVARAELSVNEYFTSVDHAMYAIFDLVDDEDRSRLAFSPVPKRSLPDPDGLIAAWARYYDTGSALAKRGQMPVDRPECPGFYCLWGAATPELAELQARFVAGAKAKERELAVSLAHDASGDRRAAALFVLSYGPRGEKVVEHCVAALKDSSPAVRGAALQILADMVNHHPDHHVPIEKILPLLDDPSVSVRGKAMGLLVPMVSDDGRRRAVMAYAPRLVDLLKLSQPDNHDLAYTLLGLVSRKTISSKDLVAWESWAAKASAGKAD